MNFRYTLRFLSLGLMAGLCMVALAACGGSKQGDGESPSPASSPKAESPASPLPEKESPAPTPDPNRSELTKTLEKAASDLTAKEVGVPVTFFACPNQADKLEAGKSFECDAKVDAGYFKVNVTLKDAEGSFNIQTRGLLIMPKAEKLLTEAIKQQNNVDVTADCGEQVKLFKTVGEKFTCKLTTADGKSGEAEITVKDEDGTIDGKWKI